MAKTSSPPPPLDPKVGTPLWEQARDAAARGASIWTCVVVVATFRGEPIKVGHGPSSVARVSPDDLLGAVERLGWRLEHTDHVYVQTTTSTNSGFAGMSVSGVGGHVEAHYTFRRA